MEESSKLLQRIVDLLAAAGYARSRVSSLPPFDKLTGGLAWCITACDVDANIDLFYDDNATLDHKLKVGTAIEEALQKIECPHPLQAHQIQGLDYPAVFLVVHWLVEHVLTTQEKLCNQVSSLAIKKSYKLARDAEVELELEASPPLASSDFYLSKDDDLSRPRKDHAVGLRSKKPWEMESQPKYFPDAQSCHQRQAVALSKQIAELEDINKTLREQKGDLEAQLLKTEETRKDQEREESEVLLETKILKERVEKAGAEELVQRLVPLLEQSKMNREEELSFVLSCKQKHTELLTIIQNLEAEEKHCKEGDHKADVENILQQEMMKLKLLKGDMATKNQKFTLHRRKLDDVPSHSELMQYERCFVELYHHIQAKLQETRKHFATYNALAEANELTLKEISLLNSINAQFEEVVTSQGGRTKFVASMSDIVKGVSQKVEKMEARFLAEQNTLSALKKRHSQMAAERRSYENLMQLFQEEWARNEVLRSSLQQVT